ncbi:hypothetical protein NS206_00285 [Microbacterium testaceum]|nr:hypothetical protein NS206_00285 [Microbacterium testaceum]
MSWLCRNTLIEAIIVEFFGEGQRRTEAKSDSRFECIEVNLLDEMLAPTDQLVSVERLPAGVVDWCVQSGCLRRDNAELTCEIVEDRRP